MRKQSTSVLAVMAGTILSMALVNTAFAACTGGEVDYRNASCLDVTKEVTVNKPTLTKLWLTNSCSASGSLQANIDPERGSDQEVTVADSTVYKLISGYVSGIYCCVNESNGLCSQSSD